MTASWRYGNPDFSDEQGMRLGADGNAATGSVTVGSR